MCIVLIEFITITNSKTVIKLELRTLKTPLIHVGKLESQRNITTALILSWIQKLQKGYKC